MVHFHPLEDEEILGAHENRPHSQSILMYARQPDQKYISSRFQL